MLLILFVLLNLLTFLLLTSGLMKFGALISILLLKFLIALDLLFIGDLNILLFIIFLFFLLLSNSVVLFAMRFLRVKGE